MYTHHNRENDCEQNVRLKVTRSANILTNIVRFLTQAVVNFLLDLIKIQAKLFLTEY